MDSDELNRMALLNVKKVSEWLLVKPSTLYVWAEQGTIPHLKLGRLLRFDSDEIEVWLKNHRREGIQEPASPRRRHGTDSVDALIAQAKAEVYTSSRGKPDQGRATRKGDSHGSV
jgi:excisionase family DNA binding protein